MNDMYTSSQHVGGQRPPPPSPLAIAALKIAATGRPVFPCAANKKPTCEHGFHDASTDPETIRTLFSNSNAKLIGIPTGPASDIDVLDIDPRHGGDLWETANLAQLPETRMHSTGGGGRHYLFRSNPDLRNSEGKIDKHRGVDVRATGGYIIWWPSCGGAVASDAELAPWPAWLLEKALKAPEAPRPATVAHQRPDQLMGKRYRAYVDRLLANVTSAAEGLKHETLLFNARALGGILARANITEADAHAWLIEALPDTVQDWASASKTAWDGLRHGQAAPFDLEERAKHSTRREEPPPHEEARTPPPEPEPEQDDATDKVDSEPGPEPRVPPPSPDHAWLEVLTPDQIGNEQPRPYVVKGLLAQGDHAMIMGHPGSGKSVAAPHIAYAVAQGVSVLGRRVKGGPVVYLSAEDPHGMKGRIRALRDKYGHAPDFYLVPVTLDLMNAGKHREAIEDLIRRVQPILIVVDTLAKAFPGWRENDPDGMGPVVRTIRDLSAISNAAILSVHHIAKDGGTTPRGHGSLAADLDISMLIEGELAQTRTIRLGKNRNGPSDASFSFNIEVVELGLDEDGDLITAPIAVETQKPATAPNREAKLADKPALLLRTLRNLDPEVFVDRKPEPEAQLCRSVSRSNLRAALIKQGWFPEHMLSRGLSDGELTSNLVKPGFAFENNHITPLKRLNIVGFDRDWIWLV